jgi:hypothetical protein
VDLAGNALVKASGVPGTFTSELNDHILTVKIPIELSDITLFMDLLPYILPFGIRVSVIRNTVVTLEHTTPIGASAIMRKALPGYGPQAKQSLGLAKISYDGTKAADEAYKVEYSNSNFTSIKPDTSVNVPANTYEAIAGIMGATPVIAFETDNSIENKEETT